MKTNTISLCDGKPNEDLQFLSSSDFDDSIERIVNTFPRAAHQPRTRYETIANNYGELLKRSVVFEPNFGSCVVYLPCSLTIDLKAICAYSGYIHSCGANVYLRNIYKATKSEFYRSIQRYLEQNGNQEKKILFRAYSHEDFTAFDRSLKTELQSGLDEVKIFTEKLFMGKESVAETIEDMREVFSANLVIPPRGSYKINDPVIRQRDDVEKSKALFLIVDHSISNNHHYPGDRHFFICYEQQYINQNPCHSFDENKPAWVDHTTIPHTLVGAMINVTRPYWPSGSVIRVLDPFLGSGTTWLEVLKFDEVKFHGMDIELMTPLLAEDNAYLFGCSAEDTAVCCDQLLSIEDKAEFYFDPFADNPGLCPDEYRNAVGIFQGLILKSDYSLRPITSTEVEKLRQASISDRLMFYLILRTTKRYAAALKTKSINWKSAFKNQGSELAEQFERLTTLKERIEGGVGLEKRRVVVVNGEYSESCSLNPQVYLTALEQQRHRSEIQVMPVTELQEIDAYDVIITDPPYGFNVESEVEQLAALYIKAFEAMIRALKDGGQLVFAIPDWSHTGRQLPSFTHKNFITHQILIAAENASKEVFSTASQAPQGKVNIDAPYYWESERALRRAILHFRFRSLPKYRRAQNGSV